MDPTLGLPSIPVNVSTDLFVHHAESLDTNLVLKDLDLDFIQTTAGAPKGESNNPEKALVRHEYLELIVRLACRKFLSSKSLNLKLLYIRLNSRESSSSSFKIYGRSYN